MFQPQLPGQLQRTDAVGRLEHLGEVPGREIAAPGQLRHPQRAAGMALQAQARALHAQEYLALARDRVAGATRHLAGQVVLHRVQQTFGYIPREVAFEVADLLDVPLAKIYGVITFYNFFKLKKPGRNQIQVCLGTACYLKGGEDIIHEMEGILGVGLNTVTPDGEFSVEAVRCLGCCGLAPVMVINGEVHGKVQTKDLHGIIAKIRKG